MKTIKSIFFQIIKRKESPLFLILFISGISLSGWLFGKIVLASYSLKYIPIPYSSALLFITISILLLIIINFKKTRLIKSLVIFSVLTIAFYCCMIFLDFLFNFKWDFENIFIKNPERFGNVPIGRMSPISSILFVFICICIFSIIRNNSKCNQIYWQQFLIFDTSCFLSLINRISV